MKLELLAATDPLLCEKATPIVFPRADLAQMYSGMLAIMLMNKGIGLAAPQVGVGLRMFVFWHEREIGAVVNPEILSRSSETVASPEGCLTFPGQAWQVQRARTILITYQDINGIPTTRPVDGLLAIIFQHETDHLDGVLISQHGKQIKEAVRFHG